MSTRRQHILDAAITVLGSRGPRGLTHRAVDRELGLPQGSTANVFGRRSELLTGIVQRMEELDHGHWEELQRESSTAGTAGLGHHLAAFVHSAAAPPLADIQRARYHLQLTCADQTAPATERLTTALQQLIGDAGGDRHRARVILATVDGLILRAVTYGAQALPSPQEVAESLQLLMDDGDAD